MEQLVLFLKEQTPRFSLVRGPRQGCEHYLGTRVRSLVRPRAGPTGAVPGCRASSLMGLRFGG